MRATRDRTNVDGAGGGTSANTPRITAVPQPWRGGSSTTTSAVCARVDDCVLDAGADEAQLARRHPVQSRIGLTVAHRLDVLLDRNHGVPTERERHREQAAAGVQVGHDAGSIHGTDLRDHIGQQRCRSLRIRLEERGG